MSEDAHELVCSGCGKQPALPYHRYCRACKQQSDREFRRNRREERERERRRHRVEFRAEYWRDRAETV